MFENSLLESGKRFKDGRRGASTLVAFVLQALLLGTVLLIPLFYTDVLPKPQLMTMLVAPPPPPPPPPPPAAAPAVKAVKRVQTNIAEQTLRTPMKIPEKVQIEKDEAPPQPAPPAGGVVGGMPGGVPGGQLGGVIGGIVSSVPAPVPAIPKPAVPQRVRVSQGIVEGLLLHKVMPAYPPLARQARISGSVVLQAVINKNGGIEDLRLVQGNPLLASAAINAVKQWRYRPYLLSGEPVEVETMITVNFTLA